MNRDEFLDAVLGPMKSLAADREIERVRGDIMRLTTAPIDESVPITIGCFGPNYQLVFGASDNFDMPPSLRAKFDDLHEADLSGAVAEAAREFCALNSGCLTMGVNIDDMSITIIVETLFCMYVRSKGGYTPRAGFDLRIANLQFTNVHSNSQTCFLAYWTKRR